MSVFYKVVQRRNPQKLNESGKFYAKNILMGEVTIDKLTERISRTTTAARGDIHLVIISLVDEIIDSLENGQTVRLGELGSMRLSVSSTGEEDAGEVTANNIRKSRVIFTPGMNVKNRINRISFKQYGTTTTNEGEKEPEGGL